MTGFLRTLASRIAGFAAAALPVASLILLVAVTACHSTEISAEEAQRLTRERMEKVAPGMTKKLEAAGATFEVKASDHPESECFLALSMSDYMEYLDRDFPQEAAYIRDLAHKLTERPHYAVEIRLPVPPDTPGEGLLSCMFFDRATGEFISGISP